MPKVIKIEKINGKRMEIKAKGYVAPYEAWIYLGVSKDKARVIYKEIKDSLEANGVKVNACGISSDVFNKYLGITNEDIYNNYKLGY